MTKGKEASIIEIIEEMVRAGESEEKIVQTLKDIGISDKQAKKLLLLGEADTFALLKNEIRKIVKEDMEKEKEVLLEAISDEIEKSEEKVETHVKKAIEEMRKSLKQQIAEQQTEEDKKEKMREIVRMLEQPKASHGIKYDAVVHGKKVSKDKEKKVKEVKL